MPSSFSGSAADNSGGVGLNANSTPFTLQRGADSFYWTGSAWQSAAFSLATTHSAQQGGQAVAWTSNASLPAWGSQSDGTYTVTATETDAAGNNFTGAGVSFTLDNTTPTPFYIGVATDNDATVTSYSVPATRPIGETVFVAIAMDPSTSNVSVTDSAGNTYTKDADIRNGSSSSGVRTRIFRGPITPRWLGGSVPVNFPGPTPQNKSASFFSFNDVCSLDRLHTSTGNYNAPNSCTTAKN